MAVMTPAGQRAALKTLLEGLPGITGGLGMVYDYRRVIRDEAQVKALLVGPSGNGRVNGWFIYPATNTTTVSERHPGHHGIGVSGGGNVLTTMQWVIEGIHALEDADGSEKTFGDLAWSVADTINSYGLLDIPGITHQLPADVDQLNYIMMSNFALYHHCLISCAFRGRTRPTP